MAVSLDTFDREFNIHPRNKQLPCKRLAYAGLNIAYGLTDFPTNGPFPTTIDQEKLPDGIQISISYDQEFTWNSSETQGFYICTQPDFETCINQAGMFQKISSSVSVTNQSLSFKVDLSTIAVAYLWETTPVLGTEALPIYANNEFKLPGAPWMIMID